jgi:hypothetical protein
LGKRNSGEKLEGIGIAILFVFGAVFTGGLAYWTVKSWRDTPLFNLAFWAVIGLVAVYAGWKKRTAKQPTRRE